MIEYNIFVLYMEALHHPDLTFIVPYQKDTKNLNGYSGSDMFSMFIGALKDNNMKCPDNILFHNSFKEISNED